MIPYVKQPPNWDSARDTDPYFYEEPEPTDEDLGWNDVPINIHGETEEEDE